MPYRVVMAVLLEVDAQCDSSVTCNHHVVKAMLLEVETMCFPCKMQSSCRNGGAVGGGGTVLPLSRAIITQWWRCCWRWRQCAYYVTCNIHALMSVLLKMDALCFPCHLQSTCIDGGAVCGEGTVLPLPPAIIM